MTIYLKCQGFSLQHIQYIDRCTQLMNFIGFPPFYLLLHYVDVGNEMEIYRVIKSLFPHLWRVLPLVLIPGTDSMNEQKELLFASAAISWLLAVHYKVNVCSFNVLVPYLLL